MSPTHPVHTFPLYFPKIHPFISSFHLQLSLSSGLLPPGFRPKPFMYFSFLPCVLHTPSDPPLFDHSNIWWRVQVMKLHVMQCSQTSRHLFRLRSNSESIWRPF